jgi:hypothetical protein
MARIVQLVRKTVQFADPAPEKVPVLDQVPAGKRCVRRVDPFHLAEAGECASKMREVDGSVRVVVREAAEPQPVCSHLDDCEGLVGERPDVGGTPRGALSRQCGPERRAETGR